MNNGKFITLEGGEGVGKTSNLAYIADYFRERGIPLTVTREPGGTPLGESLRMLVLGARGLSAEAELLMIFAARAQHVREVIAPALAAGRWVLSDRFTDASYAYQGGGRGIPAEVIRFLEDWALGSLQPDLTLLLDAPVEIGLARLQARGAMDRFESEPSEFQQRVRTIYRQRASAFPERIRLIDASRPLDLVRKDIAAELDACLADGL